MQTSHSVSNQATTLPLITPQSKIAILGAGAAGVSAAHYLRQKGYAHITLYDRRPRVGGKCLTQTIGDRNYELGALVVGNAYDCIHSLIKTAGLTTIPLDPIKMMDTTAPHQLERTDYRHYARPLLSMAKVLSVYLMKYRRFLSPPGFDGLEKTDLANCTMDQWLAKYHLDHLKALLAPYYVSWGYGYLEQVSAAYVFKLLDFYIRILERIYLFPQKNRPSSYLLEGYQKLFEIIAQPFELIIGADITQIDRHRSIDILCNGKKQTFDALILAAPFQKTTGVLDTVAKERILFGKIKTFNFYTVTATVKNLPPDHLVFIPNHLTSHRAGHMVSWYRRWPDRDVVVFYLLSHQFHNMERLVADLRGDLARVGVVMTKVIRCDHWDYFPHVSPSDFANGFYAQFEQMQGRHNTWYIGELLSFATVEHVVAYSRDLVERYF